MALALTLVRFGPWQLLRASVGYEILAPDLPGYGVTEVPDPAPVTHPDWVNCAADLLRAQREVDARPLVLLGASMGGLLGYAASARVPGEVAHLLATCLLDPSNPNCGPALSRLGGAVSVRVLRPFMVPMARGRGLAPARANSQGCTDAIANQPELARLSTFWWPVRRCPESCCLNFHQSTSSFGWWPPQRHGALRSPCICLYLRLG